MTSRRYPPACTPETAVICAGRPSRPGAPLNIPVVLASNFHASIMAAPGTEEAIRSYARTDATPTWEALETAVGQVEGGHAVAFSSGMAAVAAVLGLVPAGGADLLWLETPSNPLLDIADLPALCAAGRHAGAIVGVDNTFATPLLQQPLALGADVVVHSATNSSAATLTCCPASPLPATRPSPGASATAAAYRAQPPEPWKHFWHCAACALVPCGLIAASATPANSPAGSMSTLPSAACATPAFPATPDTAQPPRR